ncbi:sigma-70 family RNA polymerase sigma factor [Streptomyces sp. MUM 136J]|uniref:sigma-70 family RNA polymerase sigma factor n=1 Tax=Streptomyces sp. MUM 136J TaxID=2791992 RepID=UPI001F043914|nr:sigma-70 family RNA polymerase sigma factor [Streptomyces sp. MUM 136J]MCH0573456.1 sigma-70 family RNA polymerase sigma factor [Streptomyces sp. MUM 136J]
MSDHDPAHGTDRPATESAPPGSPGQRQGARQQTDQEFSAFYRENIRPLTGFLINHGVSVEVAADIAQEVMTDAYRNWGQITYPKPWVHKAASRALVRKVASVEEPVDDLPEPTSLVPRPDAIAEWEAQHDALPLLRSLPMKQRQVMAWTLAGFTPTDIADHLGLPAENVRANLKKARCTAVAYLKAREGEL